VDRFWFRLSVVALLLALVTLVVTLFPTTVGSVPGWWVYGVLFPGAFLLGFRMMVLQRDGVKLDEARKSSPRGARVAFNVLGLFILCNLAIGIFLAPGEPVQYGANYYFNDHGDLIRVSYARYLLGKAAWTSGFVATAALFYYASALVNRAALRRRSHPSPMAGTSKRD